MKAQNIEDKQKARLKMRRSRKLNVKVARVLSMSTRGVSAGVYGNTVSS